MMVLSLMVLSMMALSMVVMTRWTFSSRATEEAPSSYGSSVSWQSPSILQCATSTSATMALINFLSFSASSANTIHPCEYPICFLVCPFLFED
jgi:hypothetical protein